METTATPPSTATAAATPTIGRMSVASAVAGEPLPGVVVVAAVVVVVAAVDSTDSTLASRKLIKFLMI